MADNKVKYDFSGWATKANILCADGRTILENAFKHNDGKRVPLVWQHLHDTPENILGYAVLEHRAEGVYTYCAFNETPAGQMAKSLVRHGDIEFLSIYANQLVESNKKVSAGNIREVSLVLAGANPGAVIDNLAFAHGDIIDRSAEEALIFTGVALVREPAEAVAQHADTTNSPAPADKSGRTVKEVIDSMDPDQQDVLYALLAQAIEQGNTQLSQSISEEGDNVMKTNIFDRETAGAGELKHAVSLTDEQLKSIFNEAVKGGSLRESFLAHAVTYGIENIDYLFPDAKSVTPTPTFVQRDMAWVGQWMNSTKHSPFSRIKSLFADITEDTARALGYIKGALKKEEFFTLAKRVTTPTTIYKKQKLDRDDIIDIVDLDVVAWMKSEMRMMLDEEVARACLIGDGRDVASADKIDETCIRPIYKDDALYAFHVSLAAAKTTAEIMEEIVRARKDYKGTGNPVMFTTTDFLTDMLLLKDTTGRRIYPTVAELKSALRVSDIVEVPVMEGVTRTDTTPDPDVVYDLLAILVNPVDYTIGADRGGAVSMFDDFDIDYNQYKYLLETRLSGCLINPKTAMIVEQAQA